MRNKITAIIPAVVALVLIVGLESAWGQYARYTTRPIATTPCASGACPSPASSTTSAPKAAKVDKPKIEPPDVKETKEEETIVEPTAAEPGVASESDEKDGAEVEQKFPAAPETLGGVTLIYPSDAQSKDEVIAFAARRAREPVDEDDDPIDTETPIGFVRTVGARLKELTAAVESQQKTLESFASKDGGNGAILDALKKLREDDQGFQKDARESLRTLLDAVKKQNETVLTQGRERIRDAVLPSQTTYVKWGLWTAIGVTLMIVWIILVVKLVAWIVKMGKTAVERGLQAAVAGVRTSANVLTARSDAAGNNDEIRL